MRVLLLLCLCAGCIRVTDRLPTIEQRRAEHTSANAEMRQKCEDVRVLVEVFRKQGTALSPLLQEAEQICQSAGL
jgi:hypothetical protein